MVEGLIDDNPIDDEGSEAEDSDADIGVGKRKKARSDEDDQLEEDDFDLIEENLGIKASFDMNGICQFGVDSNRKTGFFLTPVVGI